MGNQRCLFRVWAPFATRVELHLVAPTERVAPMQPARNGYFENTIEDVEPGARYFYRLDGGRDLPDPASRFQPEGVHGPSEVVNPEFPWSGAEWAGRALEDYIFYELHVGVFTPGGTFDAVIPYLDRLLDLGVTAIELMPVAQFPGARNWGYDGASPFAVHSAYGGPNGFKRLVNACHQRDLAVVLDVVYNHLGPEGNYLGRFGPYFTDRYRTPWGPAVNFDGPDSDQVRRYFIGNALYWIAEFHIDALRLDAVHAIFDQSAYPFLEELGDTIHREADRLGRPVLVIAESDLNDPRLLREKERGGLALDAQWNDEFHHALRGLLTADRAGYYVDFGNLAHLVKAWREGYVHTGQYSAHRRRRHGRPATDVPPRRLVVCSQNHDQVGNRARGERLTQLVSFESLKLAAACALLSPFVPLLFMGEEYGETAPFLYFVSHSDPDLIAAVRHGRKEEFAAFAWQGEPPDPQADETFLKSKLNLTLGEEGRHRILLDYYRELIRLRKTVPSLARLTRERMKVEAVDERRVMSVRRAAGGDEIACWFHFGEAPAIVPAPPGRWRKLLDSSEDRWGGPGSTLPGLLDSPDFALPPQTVVLYRKETDE